jgi:hypothetical protein
VVLRLSLARLWSGRQTEEAMTLYVREDPAPPVDLEALVSRIVDRNGDP